MAKDLAIACKCGQVTAVARGVSPARGTLCICYCRDCRAFARHIGATDLHDANGGIEIFQLLPGRITFKSGVSQLKAMRLSEKGLLRWYAGCCGTPMGNMLPTSKIRFMGLAVAAFTDPDARTAMGPCLMSHRAEEAPNGATPIASFGEPVARRRAFLRHLASMFWLSPRGFPYFENGAPIAPVEILTEEERKAAYGSDRMS